jgi:hypothetical protein
MSSSTTQASEPSQISNVSSWLMPQLAREVLLEREANLARSSLRGFVVTTMPDYRFGWFNELLCAKLDQFLDDEAIDAEVRCQEVFESEVKKFMDRADRRSGVAA